MAMTMGQIALEARGLPAAFGAASARQLIASAGETEDSTVKAPWVEEVKRRQKDVEEGRVEQAFQDVRRRLAK